MSKFCTNCGSELKPGAKFCTNCGQKIEQQQAEQNAQTTAFAGGAGIYNNAEKNSQNSTQQGFANGAFKAGTNEQQPKKKFLNLGDGLNQLFHDKSADKQAILTTLFFTFKGRLNRQSYIFRGLFLSVTLGFIETVLTLCADENVMGALDIFMLLIALACSLLSFWAGLALNVRRLHDLDKSGWWLLVMCIPVVNFFFGLYILFFKGTQGRNQYGDDPLQG